MVNMKPGTMMITYHLYVHVGMKIVSDAQTKVRFIFLSQSSIEHKIRIFFSILINLAQLTAQIQ